MSDIHLFKVEANAPADTRWSNRHPAAVYAIAHPLLGVMQNWLIVEERLQFHYTPRAEYRTVEGRSERIPQLLQDGRMVYQIGVLNHRFVYKLQDGLTVGPLWPVGKQPGNPTMQELVNQLFAVLAPVEVEEIEEVEQELVHA